MLIHRRLIVFLPLAALAACGSLEDFRDGQPIAAGRAPVLIYPRYGFGPGVPQKVELTFTRIDSGRTEDFPAARVTNYDVSIIELPPGFYFLRRVKARVHVGYGSSDQGIDFEHKYEPKLTLFEVREGRINYPGDWVIPLKQGASSGNGSLGTGGKVTTEYRTTMWVEEDQEAGVKLSEKYPALNAKLPLRVTRVQAP